MEGKESERRRGLRTGKPEKKIIAVLKGESSIISEMTILFENITRIPAHFWINKQAKYNKYKARLKRQLDVEKRKKAGNLLNLSIKKIINNFLTAKEELSKKKTIPRKKRKETNSIQQHSLLFAFLCDSLSDLCVKPILKQPVSCGSNHSNLSHPAS
jgi:plasmid maintenance system antidote protein VapI